MYYSYKSIVLSLLFIYQIMFACSGMFNKKMKDYSTMVIQNVNSGKGDCCFNLNL